MIPPIINVQSVSKRYRLGSLGVSSLKDSLSEWWQASVLGKPTFYQEDSWDRVNSPDLKRKGQVLWALKDVSFQVQPGEMVGIIGHNRKINAT